MAAAWRELRGIGVRPHFSEIGYVLQTGGLLPFLNVAQNIRVSRRLLGLAEDGFAAELMGWLAIERLAAKMPHQKIAKNRGQTTVSLS